MEEYKIDLRKYPFSVEPVDVDEQLRLYEEYLAKKAQEGDGVSPVQSSEECSEAVDAGELGDVTFGVSDVAGSVDVQAGKEESRDGSGSSRKTAKRKGSKRRRPRSQASIDRKSRGLCRNVTFGLREDTYTKLQVLRRKVDFQFSARVRKYIERVIDDEYRRYVQSVSSSDSDV